MPSKDRELTFEQFALDNVPLINRMMDIALKLRRAGHESYSPNRIIRCVNTLAHAEGTPIIGIPGRCPVIPDSFGPDLAALASRAYPELEGFLLATRSAKRRARADRTKARQAGAR